MSVFDFINTKLGKWIQARDIVNGTTIEDFDYAKGVHGSITSDHCEKCVSANECWFKDEEGKNPELLSLTGIELLDSIINKVTPGLYHFFCHCHEFAILTPTVEDIKLIIPQGKIDWLKKDKSDWITSFGYEKINDFLDVLYDLIKKAYCAGNYEIINHDKHGVKINLFISIPGKGLKENKTYNIKSAFMIFPNGKLKCNTLLGGRQ